MRPIRGGFLLAAAVLVAACSDEGPRSGPGPLTVRLLSPNGAEGAALITLFGDGLGAISPIGTTTVHVGADPATSSTRVLLVDLAGGELGFQLQVPDTTQPPTAVIEQVAAPDDALRASLDGYLLEFRR